MDISETLAPNSDQMDAVDLLGAARTFTISGVSRGSAEQPVNVDLAEFPRPWRPGKSMRRVLAACWGTDASAYVGRRVELYCDPTVEFGGAKVGGIRVRALSHIDKPRQVPLLIKRGKSAMYTVGVLPDAPAPPATPALSDGEIEAATTVPELRRMWPSATPVQRHRIEARVAELIEEPSS